MEDSLHGVAVMTSGGDCQGMNAAVRSIVRGGITANCKPWCIKEGYQGLVDGQIIEFRWDDVSGFLGEGGTAIGTSRCLSFRDDVLTRRKAVYNLVSLGIDRLICIGGDGSLSGANVLREEWPMHIDALVKEKRISEKIAARHAHFFVVGIVGSIDNDMVGTDYTIGTDSALHRIVDALDAIGTTASSHQRSFVVEVMGRNCGYLTLVAGIATGADWIFIPEQPPGPNWRERIVSSIKNRRTLGARHSLILVAEGAVDSEGKKITVTEVKDLIEKEAGYDTRITILGHIQRGGVPSAWDRTVATLQGLLALDLVIKAKPGSPSILVGMHGNKVVTTDLMDCVRRTSILGRALNEKNYQLAYDLRGELFHQCWNTFKTLARAYPHTPPDSKKRFNWGILHCGAPAPGMNGAVRAIVRLSLDRGHSVYGFFNGFQGLEKGDSVKMLWRSVANWATEGGALLGTNRLTPMELDVDKISENIRKFGLDGLFVIGGWEGYLSCTQLQKLASKHPALAIPVIAIPATISNNVPATEYALGGDTALNTIVDSSDRLKKSAVSTRCRVFIMEVHGGNCGYLATMASIAGGATNTYIPETGIKLSNLTNDIEKMKNRFLTCRSTSIIINSEKSSKTYTTKLLEEIYTEESEGRYDVRALVLGHIQQGNYPSPIDRQRASMLAHEAVVSMEFHSENKNQFAGAIGMIEGKIVTTHFNEIIQDMNMKARRPLKQWWMDLLPVIDRLRGNQTSSEYRPLQTTLFSKSDNEGHDVKDPHQAKVKQYSLEILQKDPPIPSKL
eukprot:TRINITY_DN6505_c0_g2_i1.p1 TRINITY_DN6505_c0_g2~~TRINITY_DN6505_c0_g2_i1.p1  ORF type:complete len:788 (+),score=188.14 TRINITY_DN6505_c0_g2_i1:2551-4914(+)